MPTAPREGRASQKVSWGDVCWVVSPRGGLQRPGVPGLKEPAGLSWSKGCWGGVGGIQGTPLRALNFIPGRRV